MAAFNHNLPFRPLMGGIGILNPIVNQIGTLGCIATSDGADRWIISCYHVLCRVNSSAFNVGEEIYQPLKKDGIIARTALQRADTGLDCAAAIVEPGVVTVPNIFGIGEVTGVAAPSIGARVLKSGSTTGVTEGIVTRVTGDRVEIEPALGFDPQYEIADIGDSGAAWVNADDGAIVAIQNSGTVGRALATVFSSILQKLNLRLP